MKSDNVLILTVARCASTFYQHHIAIERKIKNLVLASSLIDKSVTKLLENETCLTKDLGGTSSTAEITKNLTNILKHLT